MIFHDGIRKCNVLSAFQPRNSYFQTGYTKNHDEFQFIGSRIYQIGYKFIENFNQKH